MALTRKDKEGDGTTTVYDLEFSLGYLREDFVYVYLTGDDYTNQLSYSWLGENQIQLSTPLATGVEFHIRRVVQRRTLVNDYEDGAILREDNLDDSFLQTLMILEEVQDGYSSPAGPFVLATDVDMLLNKITNLQSGTEDGDAVNLGQIIQLLKDLNATGGSIVQEDPPLIALEGQQWTRCSDLKEFFRYGSNNGGAWVSRRPNYVATPSNSAAEVITSQGKSLQYTNDDWQGFSDALYAEAGKVDSGIPDTAIASQRLDAIKTVSVKETLDKLTDKVPVNGGVWASGQEFNFYNEYMIYDGEAYSPLPATVLPYTVGATPDLGFVYQIKLNSLQALSGLTEPSDLDQVHRRVTTVAAVEAGNFTAGAKLELSDRAGAKFNVVDGGTPNGYDAIDAGNGNTAVLQTYAGLNILYIGASASSDLSIYLTAAQASGHSVVIVPPLPEGASYTTSSRYDTSAAIILDMTGAKINVTHNDDFIRLQHPNSKTIGGKFIGTGKGDATKPLQAAIRIWPNTINCVIDSPEITAIAGDLLAGGIVITNTVMLHQGNRIINPTMYDNNVALNLGNKAEYITISGGSISNGNNIGIHWRGGNNVADSVTLSNNVVAVDVIAGSNDSHGSLNGCTINHNTTPFRVGAINTKQFEFNGCHIFFGTGELNGCEGVVFNGGEMGNLIINEDGCRNCFVVGVNIGAGGITPVPNHNGNNSEVFYLDLIQPIAVSAKTSSRLNGLRVFADNNGGGTIIAGRSKYVYPRVSQRIPYNAAYAVQPVYDVATGNLNAEEFKCRGGFEIPLDVRLSLSKTSAWDPTQCSVYIENLDTGARVAELMPQTLFVSESNNIYTYQFSGVVDKVNLGLFVENNTGGTLSTFSDQASSIRSYMLTTLS